MDANTTGSYTGWNKWWPRIVSVSGLIGIFWTATYHSDRLEVLLFFGAMAGILPVARLDKALGGGGGK